MTSLRNIRLLLAAVFATAMVSCSGSKAGEAGTSMRYALYFDLGQAADGTPFVECISPYDSHRDTFFVRKPVGRIVCMSTTHVACLDAVGASSTIVGVSGVDYLSNEGVKAVASEVGYDAYLDYETVLSLKPDLLVGYSVAESEPEYVSKLRSLGIPVFLISDHLEQDPLARAEYVRLFGQLTGTLPTADEFFDNVCREYDDIRSKIALSSQYRVPALINIPYSGQWFVPGEDNYTTKLVHDAGGEILGAMPGSASSVISLEKAFVLSSQAKVWLNPGSVSTREELVASDELFREFPISGMRVYNNTLRVNPEGGNDFWESGAVHPERILKDLAVIFNPGIFSEDSLYYYVEVK